MIFPILAMVTNQVPPQTAARLLEAILISATGSILAAFILRGVPEYGPARNRQPLLRIVAETRRRYWDYLSFDRRTGDKVRDSDLRPDVVLSTGSELVFTDPLDPASTATKYAANMRLFICGGGGAGKTFFSWRIAEYLNEEFAKSGEDSDRPIPLVLEVHNWDGRSSITDWIEHELKENYDLGPGSPVADLIRSKRILPIFDGLNELPPNDTEMIETFVDRLESYIDSPNCPVGIVLTSRTKYFREVLSRDDRARIKAIKGMQFAELEKLDTTRTVNTLERIAESEISQMPPTERLHQEWANLKDRKKTLPDSLIEAARIPLYASLMAEASSNLEPSVLCSSDQNTESLCEYIAKKYVEYLFDVRNDHPRKAATWLREVAIYLSTKADNPIPRLETKGLDFGRTFYYEDYYVDNRGRGPVGHLSLRPHAAVSLLFGLLLGFGMMGSSATSLAVLIGLFGVMSVTLFAIDEKKDHEAALERRFFSLNESKREAGIRCVVTCLAVLAGQSLTAFRYEVQLNEYVRSVVFALALGILLGIRPIDARPTRRGFVKPQDLRPDLDVAKVLVTRLSGGIVVGVALWLTLSGPYSYLSVGLNDSFTIIDGLLVGCLIGAPFGFIDLFRNDREIRDPRTDNEGRNQSSIAFILYAAKTVLVLSLAIWIASQIGLLSRGVDPLSAVTGGIVSGVFLGLRNGGGFLLRRSLIWLELRRSHVFSIFPDDTVQIFDWAEAQMVGRRMGGGFQFRHRDIRIAIKDGWNEETSPQV